MFYVCNKEDKTKYDNMEDGIKIKRVYAVQYKNGYPFFTFYENGQWITRSAKFFIPCN